MKNILFFLLILSTFTASAQRLPFNNQLEAESQLWYTGNVYFNTPTSANLGQQLDTVTNTATLNLYSSQFFFNYKQSVVNADTALPAPVGGGTGWGAITLTSQVYKCTGTPTVTVTPISSSDGIVWAQIPGTTVATVVPTSLTIPLITKFSITTVTDRYYGLQITGSGSSTISTRGWYYLRRPYVFGNN